MSIGAQPVPSDKTQDTDPSDRNRLEELRQTVQTTIRPLVAALFNQALADQMTALLGRPKGQHRASLVPQPTDLVCPACGRHTTRDFVRKGHYRRSLLTLWGWLDLSVPRAECTCGHCPPVPFDVLSAYNRLWSDMDRMTCACIALDVRLRNTSMVLPLQNGQQVSVGTVQRRVRRVTALADWEMRQKLARSPAVIMLDALWGTRMVDTGEKKRDKKGRLRRVKRGVQVPLLVAMSIEPATGATRLVAWVQGTAENVEDWTALLTALYERGIHADRGLRLFIHDGCAALESALAVVDFGPVRRQRCVFHTLRNVARDVTGEPGMSRVAKAERLQAVLGDASSVYEAPTEEEARQRARRFCERWQEKEPKAVATFQRDIEATLAYYGVAVEAAEEGEAWPLDHLRTTSPLEGRHAGLRAKWRQAKAFWSAEGQRGALWLVCRRQERPETTDPTVWVEHIMAALHASDQCVANFPKL